MGRSSNESSALSGEILSHRSQSYTITSWISGYWRQADTEKQQRGRQRFSLVPHLRVYHCTPPRHQVQAQKDKQAVSKNLCSLNTGSISIHYYWSVWPQQLPIDIRPLHKDPFMVLIFSSYKVQRGVWWSLASFLPKALASALVI